MHTVRLTSQPNLHPSFRMQKSHLIIRPRQPDYSLAITDKFSTAMDWISTAMGINPTYSQNTGTTTSPPAQYPLPVSFQNGSQPVFKDRDTEHQSKSPKLVRIKIEARVLITKVDDVVKDLFHRKQEKQRQYWQRHLLHREYKEIHITEEEKSLPSDNSWIDGLTVYL
jgi:hypothetical protein